jgi:REP element-mobilizing transposase RayT
MKRTYHYRRNLPHFQSGNCGLFITFSTWKKWILPPLARDIALQACVDTHGRRILLHAAVIMPDHVHLILAPLSDATGPISIPEITRTIKSISAHLINRALGRTGHVWQDESFDHVLRRRESLEEKTAYILENPVRAGLVAHSSDYRWIWRNAYATPYDCGGPAARLHTT